jgi:uncharacterized protein YkwD
MAGLLAGCSHVSPPAPLAGSPDQILSPESFDHTLLARAIFEESNRVRADHGVPALTQVPALDAAADEQAVYLTLAMRAEHDNPMPGEHTATERVARAGVRGLSVAENAVMMRVQRAAGAPGRDDTYLSYAAFLLRGWMNSPGHRANLLNPAFRLTGCAARLGHGILSSDLRVYATQVFVAPPAPKAEPPATKYEVRGIPPGR